MRLFGKKDPEPQGEPLDYVPTLLGENGQIEELPPGSTVLGRAHESALGLQDDPEISRRHAAVDVAAAGVRLRDLDSRNGTFVNDEWTKTAWLNDGDRVRLGDTRLVYHARKKV